jgi:hypothetical protein
MGRVKLIFFFGMGWKIRGENDETSCTSLDEVDNVKSFTEKGTARSTDILEVVEEMRPRIT